MLVGVTGGIGSGKSALARLLAERGAYLVDADLIGHRVLADPRVAAALQEAFGADVRRSDGSVDRTRVGERAFSGPEAWEALNRIVRPPLAAALWAEVERAQQAGGIVVVDAPLIYEWGEERRFDLIVVVDVDEETRLARVQERSGLGEQAVRQRMRWQMPAEEKRRRADLVVDNSGDTASLARQAEGVWRAIEERWRQTEAGQ